MPDANGRLTDATRSTLPGAVMLWHARRLLIWALGAGLAYSFVMVSTRSHCPGGFTGDGDYLDGSGQPTDVAPSCTTLSLAPSPLVQVAIAFVVLVALTRVLERASVEAEAIRTLDRARTAVVWIAVVSAVITHVWFWSIPMTETGFGGFIVPILFGGIVTETTPLSGG